MKKRVVKIPNSATIKCPHCAKKTRVSLFKDTFIGNLECKKCKQKIETPPAYCCIVCAFSKKQCPQSLIMEAKMKNLEIQYQSPHKISNQINSNPLSHNPQLI